MITLIQGKFLTTPHVEPLTLPNTRSKASWNLLKEAQKWLQLMIAVDSKPKRIVSWFPTNTIHVVINADHLNENLNLWLLEHAQTLGTALVRDVVDSIALFANQQYLHSIDYHLATKLLRIKSPITWTISTILLANLPSRSFDSLRNLFIEFAIH